MTGLIIWVESQGLTDQCRGSNQSLISSIALFMPVKELLKFYKFILGEGSKCQVQNDIELPETSQFELKGRRIFNWVSGPACACSFPGPGANQAFEDENKL